VGPGVLARILESFPKPLDPKLLVGTETSDDAAVYRLREDLALIATVDFFPPLLDDPYLFGQVAAANALSDIYAMGGDPILALNVVAFPCKDLGAEVLEAILKGGFDKVKEAGALLVGGHTIEDGVPKYGLCAIGTAHPKRILTNKAARLKDRLILTKPLGSGILATALMRGLIKETDMRVMLESMLALNAKAKDCMLNVGVNACTDITGFGLLGHALEMANGSGVCLRIESSAVPVDGLALKFAEKGVYPGGAKRNLAFGDESVSISHNVPEPFKWLLADPQTSGGLLISVPDERAEDLLASLINAGVSSARLIGGVSEGPKGTLVVA
jgi:selenide,water dikinase